ncbi:tigger transposable element-derived protein 4-like [Nephila pilipes]|uniref:Tigger transposable element-derived protein 4-like n=1 Tax=Nephila pilipes TaxID=299642 RepID=A0A8X6UIF6_NEPPI|nr:tigger transposable element-derived protein 4-like [Nephila pilipes]
MNFCGKIIMKKLQRIDVQLEDYKTCDDGLAAIGTLTDAEIIDTVNQNTDTDDVEDDDPSHSEPSISNKQAKAAMNILGTYVKRCSDIEDYVFHLLLNRENFQIP